jgi:hypothetical protein
MCTGCMYILQHFSTVFLFLWGSWNQIPMDSEGELSDTMAKDMRYEFTSPEPAFQLCRF